MANAKRTVKPKPRTAPLVVCPHCSQALNPRTATKVKRKSARQVFKEAILLALDAGQATPREIERRMGMKPRGCETANLLRVLERKGEVRLVGTKKAKTLRGVPTFLWERVTPSDRETRAKQPPSIDRARPNHKDSKRGARA